MPHTAPRLKQPWFLVTAGTALVLLLGRPLAAEKARKPTPPLTAQEYSMHDEHEQEHVAVAAEPATAAIPIPLRASIIWGTT